MNDSVPDASLRRNASAVGLVIAVALCVPGLASSEPISRCTASLDGSDCTWSDEFNLPGFDGDVLASVIWDDGSGPALYVGGSFLNFGTESMEHLAKWDGQRWAAVVDTAGLSVDDTVDSLVVFDDGSGEAIFVGGDFLTAGGRTVNHIARWDGNDWSALTGPVGNGIDGSIAAMVVHDEGSGDLLFVGGEFATAGGAVATNIARWDGERWRAFPSIGGSAFDDSVAALTVFDGRLVAAGVSSNPGAFSTHSLQSWDGQWTPIDGITIRSANSTTLAAFDDGTGNALYVGGEIRTNGEFNPNDIARWDGTEWSTLGNSPGGGLSELLGWRILSFRTIAGFDDGRGQAVFVGGAQCEGGYQTDCTWSGFVARWDGENWSLVADGGAGVINGGSVATLSQYNDGATTALYAGGRHIGDGDQVFGSVGRWDGVRWTGLTTEPGAGVAGSSWGSEIEAFARFDDGRGDALYAGGSFTIAGDVVANHIARWDGSAWEPLTDLEGNGACSVLGCGTISELEVFDDGGGESLYAATNFHCYETDWKVRLARWDGHRWSEVFTSSCDRGKYVGDMTVFNDGTGPTLVMVGQITAFHQAIRIDGHQWAGLDGFDLTWDDRVTSLEVWDDGRGEALYLGGMFERAAGYEANSIIRWDGTTWTVLEGPHGAGVTFDSGYRGVVYDMAVFDDGTGEALYVAGSFLNAGGGQVNNIAKWDGQRWSALAGDLGTGTDGTIGTLAVYDNGRGEALHVAGSLLTAGGVPVNRFAQWDGSRWSAVCPGLQPASGGISALEVHDDGSGEALFVGGSISEICGIPSNGIGRLICPRFDFGDAPDPPYPTFAANNGPRHTLVPGLNLGGNVSADPDGRPSVGADADDFDDGVVFVDPFIPGFASRVKVYSPGGAIVDGWIDFNADGDWDDPGERIFDHEPVVMGANVFTVVVPSSALIGAETIARFRISSAGVDGPTGTAPDGEVEDYEIEISPNPTRRAGDRIQP